MRDKNAAKTALNRTFGEVRSIANRVGPPYCMLAFWKPEVMEIESVLLQQVEESAVRPFIFTPISPVPTSPRLKFRRTRDDAYRLIAEKAHLELRIPARQTAPRTRVADQVGIRLFQCLPLRQVARTVENQNRLHLKRVTKGNTFFAGTALNCTFERIGESPAEPLFKPFPE